MKKLITITFAVCLLAGCATRGDGYVPLVDMQGQSQDRFDTSLSQCQAYAKQRMGAAGGAVVGAVLGALIGAVLMPKGYQNYGAGQGAIAGGLGGAASTNDTQETIVKRCLAGRGFNVLN